MAVQCEQLFWLAVQHKQWRPFSAIPMDALTKSIFPLKEQSQTAHVFLKMSLRPCSLGCGHFMSSDEGHKHYLPCLGIQHTEDAFANGSCPHCENMTMATLRSCLSFLKGKGADPFATPYPFICHEQRTASALGDLRVTV